MSRSYQIFIWKKAPFLRLLIPVILGILFEFYIGPAFKFILYGGIILCVLYSLFSLLPEKTRYRLRIIQGIIISLFFIILGAFITRQKNIRNHYSWYGNHYDTSAYIVATINEVPVEKPKSYKALVQIDGMVMKGEYKKYEGRLLVYFSKDSSSEKLCYGDRLIFKKPIQKIINTGNPGAFDYARYCSFQQVFHQVFLRHGQFSLLNENRASVFKNTIYNTRDYILKTLKKYIPGNNESSLAQALLIGYRLDLDKDLLQAYSNIGVVHLIAISGMHLGLIYFFLVWIFTRIPGIKKSKLSRVVLTLFCLWFFSLLTGAPGSVLRCAVMFSFIAIGTLFNKQNSVYNSMAISAFALLCYDPFILWDVGFQLSYLAVLGIVTTQKYIYYWFDFENKFYKEIWKVASVTLAAQVFTLPACIYYFHQFPLLFLISNMVAIPLSTIALWSCIVIVTFSFIPIVPMLIGKLAWGVIWLLNHFVLLINSFSFFLWDKIMISSLEAFFLYAVFIAFLYWLVNKSKPALIAGIAFSCIFFILTSYYQWESFTQKKIIVYNIPTHQAIDFIDRNKFQFIGDSIVMHDNLLRNFNIKPTHISFRSNNELPLQNLHIQAGFHLFYNCKILLIDSAKQYVPLLQKIALDYIILSKNAHLKIKELTNVFDCKKYIFDSSNSLWKIEQWKKECEELHLQFYSVSEQGAFVINL